MSGVVIFSMTMTCILGISAFYHDSAACLLKDGELIAAVQEERFTRKKHDPEFPVNAVRFCLRQAGLEPGQLDLVAFYDKPFVKFERLLFTYLTYAPSGIGSFLQAMPLWLKRKLWLKSIIQEELKGYDGKIIFPEHHYSHAASCFYPSAFEQAAFLTMDGVGEWTTTSYGFGQGRNLKILAEIKFPHSLGLLYSAFTYFCGFRVNSGEYKLMGLAPYGEPKFVDLIKKELIDIKDDGSFQLNLKYFNYMVGLTMTNNKFAKLFNGPPRKPEEPLTEREMDMAASVQVVTEEIMLKLARTVREKTGMKNLCLAGGVALNCVGNGKILREGIFDELWIQPAAGDAGGALGAAFYAWHRYLDKPREPIEERDRQKASLLGPAFTEPEIEPVLKKYNAPAQKVSSEDELVQKTAELIAEGKVVGWFQGRMEFGPRALGSRSILGDARSREMQRIMNLSIKYRESFRPFAPSVLLEDAPDYFEINTESPYMLLTAYVRPEKRIPETEEAKKLKGVEKLKFARSEVPAITHIDYSARLQTVQQQDNPLYYKLLSAFKRLTGCPVIINTSFNIRGEPIVCTPEDAYKCFMRTEMDYLVMDKFILDKRQQPPWPEPKDAWKASFPPD
jgi:carbamoyltransferase